MNKNLMKILGAVATIGGFLATMLANWVGEKQMDAMIDEKLRAALEEKNEEDKKEEQ